MEKLSGQLWQSRLSLIGAARQDSIPEFHAHPRFRSARRLRSASSRDSGRSTAARRPAFLMNSRYCEVGSPVLNCQRTILQRPKRVGSGAGSLRVGAQQSHFWIRIFQSFRTALGVYTERVGVCRDFQHLAITFCRALNIPARYATGYLGDIGVVVVPSPMDFSAWFEVYLGNRWWTFDARHNARRIGRVLMATGRDATDCAITTSFGRAKLTSFQVTTDEVKEVLAEPMSKVLASTSNSYRERT